MKFSRNEVMAFETLHHLVICNDICQEVKKLITIEDQMNTLSSQILEHPGIERIEKEYNNIMQGKFIC